MISLLFLLIISCKSQPSEWQILDFGVFKIRTPKGWKKIEEKGIDSYVGGLTNGKDSLWFDYGPYSPDIDESEPQKHTFGYDLVNGLNARFAIPVRPGDGRIEMFIPVNNRDKFVISGKGIHSTDTVLKIYRSVTFTESDSLKRSDLTAGHLKVFQNGSGKLLYTENCASCHSINKNLVGPALGNVMTVRDADWVYRFLTNEKGRYSDTTSAGLKKKYQMDCMVFPRISREDVDLIIAYIQNR